MARKIKTRTEHVYGKLVDYTIVQQYPPTIKELAIVTGYSAKTVRDELKALEKKGLIEREARKPRAIRIQELEVGLKNGSKSK